MPPERSATVLLAAPKPDDRSEPSAHDVRAALATRRVRLVFQPIVDLRRGSVAGYECLARFDGPPDAGPEAWLAAATAAGVADRVEALIVETALARRPDLPVDTFLSINVCPAFLLSATFDRLIERHDDLSRVVFEMTERAPVPDVEALRRILDRLTRGGALVAMDDAGAGYAGLLQMLTVRPHFVKLDRELVHGISRDPARSALAELLGELVSRLDAWLVAEGIETTEELDACIALGVPLGQGWLFATPGDGFAQIPVELSHRIVERSVAGSMRTTVASLVEEAATATAPDAAELLLAEHPAIDSVLVVDDQGRPGRLVTRARGEVSSPLIVAPSTPVEDAAGRAMTRPRETRFLPLACTDGRGRLLGVVRIERLVARLVDSSRSAPTVEPEWIST